MLLLEAERISQSGYLDDIDYFVKRYLSCRN